jgi:hypothetical protein
MTAKDSARNLRSRLTVAFPKCHFEVTEFKKYVTLIRFVSDSIQENIYRQQKSFPKAIYKSIIII